MSDTPKRPSRPAAPPMPDISEDATGLRSMRFELDAQDDLHALAMSLQAGHSTSPTAAPRQQPRRSSQPVRATIIPPLLTGGAICIGLAVAWFCTDGDSPYRRTGLVLPIVLLIAGGLLLLAAFINITRPTRS